MSETVRFGAFVVGLHDHRLLAGITARQDDNDLPLLQKLQRNKQKCGLHHNVRVLDT